MSSILLTGARAPVTLELCRALQHPRHQIVLADMPRFPIARWSRSVRQYVRIPAPAQAPQAFSAFLQRLITEHGIKHLIPTCEETFYVSRYQAELPTEVWTSPFPLLRQLHHKYAFMELAKGFFEVPATQLCSDFDDWGHTTRYVFKPIFSRFGSKVLISPTAAACQAPQSAPQDWIAQERLYGQEACVYSVWRRGELRGFAAYQPKYRVASGASVYFAPFFSEHLLDRVAQFGVHYHFHGQLSFDVMLVGKQVYALECNPRSTSGAHLLGPQLAECFFGDRVQIYRSAQAKTLKTAWLLTQAQQVFRREFWRTPDVIWQPGDLSPFLLQGLSVLELSYQAYRLGMSLVDASTQDIEFNG